MRSNSLWIIPFEVGGTKHRAGHIMVESARCLGVAGNIGVQVAAHRHDPIEDYTFQALGVLGASIIDAVLNLAPMGVVSARHLYREVKTTYECCGHLVVVCVVRAELRDNRHQLLEYEVFLALAAT